MTTKIIYAVIDLPTKIDPTLNNLIEFTGNGTSSRPAPKDKLSQFTALFNQKNKDYFKKTNIGMC